jgi:hypothetical protein
MGEEYQMSDKKFTELVDLVERCMDFQQWGFERSFSSAPDISFPYVIYNSEWCRVKFLHYGGDYAGQWSEMNVYYGRLHAENEESFMVWNDEVCWCWHSVERYVLKFLEGLSPQETVDNKKSELQIMREFRESEIGKTMRGPEWIARKHMAFWEHYGQRLFELFDLGRPDLWEQYRAFLSEVRVLKDEKNMKKKYPMPKHPGHPEIDEVC